jgi:two-component system response regulator HydG
VTRHVLVVDDDADLCRLVDAGLTARGFTVTWRTSAAEALAVVASVELDAVVTDLDLGGTDGLELCARIVADHPDLPVTVLTGYGNFDTAIAAIRAGAYDFITKPPQLDVLAHAVARAVQHHVLHREVTRLRTVATEAGDLGEILGSSPAIRRVADVLGRVVDVESSVLVVGESGTGKELVARALHRRGRRRSGPFVAINCAAMPEALLESELFGHARGAFTDAHVARTGLFTQAHGGTLLLDEIGDLPLALQPKLLRALQERTVRPVGSDVEVPFDARIVAATSRDLEAAVADGRFREDLYFRIDVIRVEVPPLRERGNDVLLLAQHFLERYARQADKAVAGFAPAVAKRLLAYAWPGNVRELQNCLERAVALARHDRLTVDDLPDRIRHAGAGPVARAGTPVPLVSLEELERAHVLRVLEHVRSNRKLAAEILGLDRKTLYRKLRHYAADTETHPGSGHPARRGTTPQSPDSPPAGTSARTRRPG